MTTKREEHEAMTRAREAEKLNRMLMQTMRELTKEMTLLRKELEKLNKRK